MPSRNEQYLEAAVNKSGTDGLPEPRTRNEKLLHRLVEEVKIQSDLNVNDETNPAYVKNRTHWAEESMIDIFPEQTLEFINNEGTYGVEIPIDLFSFGITEGDQLTVILDGVEYECILQFFDGIGVLYVGNLAILESGLPLSGNGEPFVIGFTQNEDVKGAFMVTELAGTTHTLQIRALTETVHKLDSKYIPDGIVEHINDSAIHVTSENRSKWNDSIQLCTVNVELPGDTWNSVTYGDGKFVAVTDGTGAAYSSDGITWTKTTIIHSQWHSVTYGDGKFVAVTNGTYAAYSSDGITWTKTTMPTSATWKSVTYGDGKFVAVTDNKGTDAAYSSDGITWTKTTTSTPYYRSSVTYGDGKFVAVSTATNAAVYSIDGITWTNTDRKLKTVSGTDVTEHVKKALDFV